MSTRCAGITSSLPSHNPNASQMNERLVQLTRMNGRMAGHDDNLVGEQKPNFLAVSFL